MKKNIALAVFGLFFLLNIQAQNAIKGIVIDNDSETPLHKVSVRLLKTGFEVLTDLNGLFLFENVPNGIYTLQISFDIYKIQQFSIELSNNAIDLGTIFLSKNSFEELDIGVLITDDELNADEGFTDNIAGLLQSSKDVFLRAAAFDFSAAFFRPRGLDNSYGKVLINGLEMNKLSNGRPQWANWGGLNDLQRNQNFTQGTNPNDNTFGDVAGTNQITMRASQYQNGTKISYASANRSYQNRVMASYSSGILKNGWAYAILASRRAGNNGYIKGTSYDANSFFISAEKLLGDYHSLNINAIYAQNKRGRSTALTNEVYQLKGRQYNPFWGVLNREIKNARMREINEPIVMINHYWTISTETTLNTNLSYQFGYTSNSRIDNGGTRLVNFNGQDAYLGGARNPTPEYYQNLPSFFLQESNPSAYQFEQAFLAQQQFIEDGQLNWSDLIEANQFQASKGYNSIYVLQEDRIDDKQLSFNSILFTELNDHIQMNASIGYRQLKSESYAQINSLLGGTGFLDIDFFAEENQASQNKQLLSNLAQSDLQNPNRIVMQGDRYKYNYQIHASVLDAFGQVQLNYSELDMYVGGHIKSTGYQKNGKYENGYYSGSSSLGKSQKLNFLDYGLKGGLTYKFNGQNLLNTNLAYSTKAPTIRNSFVNPRQNNFIVNELSSETILSVDASYILRTPKMTAKLTGYYGSFKNGTEINFFFSESISTFAQEVITNMERRNLGSELGIEFQLTPTLKLKGVGAIGVFTYNNNPNVYYTSNDFESKLSFGEGKTNLQGFHIASGPERAFQFGFEYRDPDFWWFGATVNHFSKSYIDVSALKRSAAFAIDFDLIPESTLTQGGKIDGYTFNDFNETTAGKILKQELLNSYALVNISGGKSWKIGDYYLGFFATVNNLFNQEYKTGGFEQSRRIGYRDQIQEQNNKHGPLFGNRYFFGNGTTYFLNLSLRL